MPPILRVSLPSDSATRHMRAAQAALVAAALLPFVGTLLFGFVYDDVAIVRSPSSSHTFSALLNIWSQSYWPGREAYGLYRPVTQFLWALLGTVVGSRAWVFHACAVLFHVVATLGVLHLLRRALPKLPAYLGALLFAVHPVHVEAVANIANSSEILVTLVAIATLALVDRIASATRPDSPLPWRAGAATALLYAFALGSKESGAVLPALLFVWWWGWRARTHVPESLPTLRHILRRGRAMWIGCALALAVVLLIRWRALGALAIQEEFVAQGIRGLSATARAWTMIGLWPLVVTLLIWPAHLSMYYGPDVVTAHTASDWQHVLVLGGVALVLLGASALARRGDRRPLAALLWITIAYLPASNLLIPTGQLLAERTLYLPSVGVMMLVAWVIDQAWRVLERSASTQRVRIAIIAPVLLVATLGGIRSHMGARSWRSDEALFRSGIASAPNASHPHYLLGDWYAKRGDQEHALPLFARAYELEPANTRLLFVYARQLRASGQQDSALAVLRDAARRESDSWSRRMLYLTNLGEIRGPDSLIAEARLISTSDTAGLYRQTRLLVGAYEEKGMTDSALHILARGAVALPHYGLLQLLYAQALQAHGDDAGAERRLALAERDPSVRRYDVALLRAKIALARADTSAAAHAILSAHEAAPRDTALARLAREVRAPSVSRATPSTSSAGGRE